MSQDLRTLVLCGLGDRKPELWGRVAAPFPLQRILALRVAEAGPGLGDLGPGPPRGREGTHGEARVKSLEAPQSTSFATWTVDRGPECCPCALSQHGAPHCRARHRHLPLVPELPSPVPEGAEDLHRELF